MKGCVQRNSVYVRKDFRLHTAGLAPRTARSAYISHPTNLPELFESQPSVHLSPSGEKKSFISVHYNLIILNGE